MAKIRIIQPTFDKETQQPYEVGVILDLGATRNKKAVDSGQAVYVDSEKLEKAIENGEKITEKVDAQRPRGGKKVETPLGKSIETK